MVAVAKSITKEEIMKTMSTGLKNARQRAGLTITKLANVAKVSRTTIEKAERGKDRDDAIRSEYAWTIVNALNEVAGTNYTVEELGILLADD